MTEQELQEVVLETAALLGWRCFHARPAQTAKGWRTAGEGNGAKGFPDIVMLHRRHRRVLFIELKAEKGRLSDDQAAWLTDLILCTGTSVGVHVWRPKDWVDGEIERVLRGLKPSRGLEAR